MWVEAKGKKFRIRDRVAGKVITLAGGYPTKTSARAAMTLLAADKLRGDALVPRGGQTTLNDWLDLWWPDYERRLKPSTQRSEQARMRNHIRPLLGHVALDDIDRLTLNRWVSNLEDGIGPALADSGRPRRKLSPKTIGNVHGLLYVIMQGAVDAKFRRTNPCVGTTLPQRAPREMRVLTDPEIERLIRALPVHWRPLVMLLVGTGLRWGEAIGLRVGRVDLLARRPLLRVEEQLQELGGGGSELIWVTPKSARSRRTVPFTRQIAEVLTALVAGQDRDAVVFRTPTGLLIRTRNFRRVWLKALEAAGLEGLRIHDLRHTHAAILLSSGETMTIVSRRLGHASQAITDLIYGHLRVDADAGVDTAVDAALVGLTEADFAAVEEEFADVLALAA